MAVSHVYSNTVADGTATSVVRPSDWNSAHNQYVTIAGNTAGQSTFSGTNIVFQGGNNFTLSAATAIGAATIIMSGANAIAQTNQTQASGNIAGIGFTSTTTGGVVMVGTNDSNGLKLAVPAYITTYAAQTNQSAIRAFGASNTGNTAGNTGVSTGIDWVLAGTNNVTISQSTAGGGPNTLWISGQTQSVQTQASGNIPRTGITTGATAGSLLVATNDTNGISLGVPAWLTAAAGGGGFTGGVSTGGNTLGNTGTQTGSVIFVGTNNITLSVGTAAGGAQTITISGPTTAAQTVQTQASGNIPRTGFTTAATAGSVLAGTHDTAGLNLGVPAWLTTTPAQTVQPNIAQGISNTGNTAGNTGTASSGMMVFAGSNMITASMSTAAGQSTLWFNATQSVQTQASGNIVGSGFTTTTTAGSVMVGTHNSAGLSLGVPNWLTVAAGGAFSAGASTDALGTTGLVNAQLVFFQGANVSLSQSVNGQSASLSISAAAGGGGVTGSWWQPEVWGSMGSTSLANGTVYLRAFELDAAYDCDMLMFQQSISSQASSTLSFSASVSAGNASSGSGSWGQTMTALWFSRVNTNETNASYNSIVSFDSKTYSLGQGYSASVSWSTNVSSATATLTTSWAVSYIKNIDGAGGITTGSTGASGSTTFSSTSTNANSFSSSYALSAPYAHVSGIRPIFFPQAGSNVPGGEYWLGLIQSTNTGSTNMSLQRPLSYATQAIVAFTGSTQNSYLEYGNSANLSTSNYRPGFGSYSASTNTTAAIPLSAVSILGSNASIWFAVAGKTL